MSLNLVRRLVKGTPLTAAEHDGNLDKIEDAIELTPAGAREWTAATIEQAEAEAGTADTRRAFTAQRVWQAITAWWTGASTAAGRAIVEAANAAAQRTVLGLGNVNNTSDADKPISTATAAALAAFNTRLDQFRDARTFYVSKRISASDSNNGTSPGEPFLTIGAAVAAANAFRVANPGEFAAIEIGPGTYVEAALPMRLRPNILVRSLKQRSVRIKPAAGQELNSFFAVDSGNMICDISFAGHQAVNTSPTDSTVGTRAWAIQFNEQANGGLGPILTASPYIKDCLSLTAEDDAGEAGSTSTGDCGGGVEVDGARVHPNSPIRSMVVYGFTQQNLGGPGAVIKNDGYAELVSFFGLFGTWHVRCETGGQATMSGGGCSEFGIYGLMADGYSPTALFTGSLRVAALEAALEVDVVSMTANRLGTKSRPASGQIMLLGGSGYVVQSSTPINASGVPVAEGAVEQAGYRVAFFNPSGLGLAANVAQGATADFRQRSQISAGCHSANYVGSGTNYNALPWNGGVPVRANEAVETNFGRVFGLIVNDVGDLRTPGNAFKVDGTTGSVTISTDEFDLSGLNAIGPFSRNGGLSTVGVQLQEVSNSTSLIASTGAPDGNTAPTQVAVKTYADNRFLQELTATAGQPISVSDTSTVDGQGFQTRNRNISISAATPSAAGTMSAGDKLKLDGIASGATANSTDVQLRNRSTHTGTQPASTITGLAAVATSGGYGDLSGRPLLGTAAAQNIGTSAGTVPVLDGAGLIPSALLPGFVDDVLEFANLAAFPVTGETGKLYISLATNRQYRWSGSVYVEINASPGSTDAVPEGSVNLYFTSGRGESAAASWWASSSSKTKLDGIAAGAEVNVQADWNAISGDAAILNKPSIPSPADAPPLAPGTAAAGTSTEYAREDHVHPPPGLVSTSAEGLVPSAGTPGGDRLFFWDHSAQAYVYSTIGPGVVMDGTTLRAEDNPWMALGDETKAATSGVKLTVRHWPQSQRLTAVPLWESSAPVGSALQIDIRIGGTSIFSTLPTIAVGGVSSTTTTAAVFSTAFVSGGQTIPAGSVVTFHVTQQPSGGGGAGLKVVLPAVRV